MDTDLEPPEPPFVHLTQGERSNSRVEIRVSHDLGDRTLVVVILLTCVIGACGVVMGRNMARQDVQEVYARDLATKYQLNTNHVRDLEAALKEMQNERR